jgi:hypothetical protein
MNSQILSKKYTTLVVVTAGLLAAVNSFAAEQTIAGRPSSPRHSSCSNATLAGRFAVINALGFVPSGPPPAPLVPNALVGVMTLDGAGNVSFEVTISVNGQISRQVQLGTYTLKADCTGQLTTQPTDLPFPISNDVVVASLDDGGEGKEFYAIGATPGGVQTFTAKRIQ